MIYIERREEGRERQRVRASEKERTRERKTGNTKRATQSTKGQKEQHMQRNKE